MHDHITLSQPRGATLAKQIETAENHGVNKTLLDHVILRSITTDQRPTHSH